MLCTSAALDQEKPSKHIATPQHVTLIATVILCGYSVCTMFSPCITYVQCISSVVHWGFYHGFVLTSC